MPSRNLKPRPECGRSDNGCGIADRGLTVLYVHDAGGQVTFEYQRIESAWPQPAKAAEVTMLTEPGKRQLFVAVMPGFLYAPNKIECRRA